MDHLSQPVFPTYASYYIDTVAHPAAARPATGTIAPQYPSESYRSGGLCLAKKGTPVQQRNNGQTPSFDPMGRCNYAKAPPIPTLLITSRSQHRRLGRIWTWIPEMTSRYRSRFCRLDTDLRIMLSVLARDETQWHTGDLNASGTAAARGPHPSLCESRTPASIRRRGSDISSSMTVCPGLYCLQQQEPISRINSR